MDYQKRVFPIVINPIPYVDIAAQHRPIKEELLSAVGEVIDTGDFILGGPVEEFERQFASLSGTRYAVGVNSGTDALTLALRSLDIGEGDEVITAPNTFVATATAIRLAGARPVFADVGSDRNIDPKNVADVISDKTRAIIPVHLGGLPCDMDAILALAERHDIHVVEDCAQAVGARFRGTTVGSLGRIGCFSLHPLKTLNACGDGGILTTNEPEIYDRLRLLRNLGLRNRDDCIVWSGNSRLDSIQAAILLVKLKYLESWTERRRHNAHVYRQHLSDTRQVGLPTEKEAAESVYHTFVIEADDRDRLKDFLDGRKIGTAVHYPDPIHLCSIGRGLGYSEGSFPIAEEQSSRILSLPIYAELTTAQLEYISDSIRSFYS